MCSFGIKIAVIIRNRTINVLNKVLMQELMKYPETSETIPKTRWFYFGRDYNCLDYFGYFGLGGCGPV